MGKNDVLIIDCNPERRYSLKMSLWQFGCSVKEYNDENEAAAHIVVERPGVIFVSLESAKVNDYYPLHRINELHSCELIVYADEISQDDLTQCIKANVSDVLLDPCSQLKRLQKIVA